MDDGILDITLLPAWGSPRVDGELKTALSRSQVFRAAIAFWTVTDKVLGASFPRALGHKDGFLCVDLHSPTEVDALASLAKNGSHVYLYWWKVATVTDFGHKESPYLLHTRILLFWYRDRRTCVDPGVVARLGAPRILHVPQLGPRQLMERPPLRAMRPRRGRPAKHLALAAIEARQMSAGQ